MFVARLLLFFIVFSQLSFQVHAAEDVVYVKLIRSSEILSAPDLELVDIKTGNQTFKHEKDKVTVIHFWATWCTPCIKELPELQQFSKKLDVNGFNVIAIAVDRKDLVDKFIRETNTDMTVMIDQYGSAMRDYNVEVLPSSYVVNRQGQLNYLARGPVEWNLNETEMIIKTLILN